MLLVAAHALALWLSSGLVALDPGQGAAVGRLAAGRVEQAHHARAVAVGAQPGQRVALVGGAQEDTHLGAVRLVKLLVDVGDLGARGRSAWGREGRGSGAMKLSQHRLPVFAQRLKQSATGQSEAIRGLAA